MYFFPLVLVLTSQVFPRGAKDEPITYEGGRSEQELIDFVNKHAGTHRLPGGGLSETAGRITELDKLAKKLAGASSNDKDAIFSQVKDAVAKNPSRYPFFCADFLTKVTRIIMPRSLKRSRLILNIPLLRNNVSKLSLPKGMWPKKSISFLGIN
jgi:hypothetical protein